MTPQQCEMAWKYGHKRQFLMDGTFGVCSARSLCFICMVIDDNFQGIVTYLCTSRKNTKAAHADYNTKLLATFLNRLKTALGRNLLGESFEIPVAITDNDARERAALHTTWENILLMLCIFHTWQAWRNGLNKYLATIPKGDGRQEVRSRLAHVLMRLLKDVAVYEEAVALFNAELVYFKSLGQKRDQLSKDKSRGGLAFLAYFQSYLKVRDFWFSWSPAGAIEAAKRLNVPLEQVARTTNHLESLNGRIKNKYVSMHMHSGRLLRIDAWILLMITKILPSFFTEREDRMRNKNHYATMRHITRKPSALALSMIANRGSPAPTPPLLLSTSGEISSPASGSTSFVPDVASTMSTPAPLPNTPTVQADFMDQLLLNTIDDDEVKISPTDDDEILDPDIAAVYGSELCLESNGNCSSSSPESLSSDNSSFSFFLDESPSPPLPPLFPATPFSYDADVALDASSIWYNLPKDVSIPFPFTSAQQPPHDIFDTDILTDSFMSKNLVQLPQALDKRSLL